MKCAHPKKLRCSSVKTKHELLGEVLGERRGDTFLVSEHGGRGKDDHVNGN